MALVEASGAVHFEPARAREVFDVSGAGDTVVAVLALAAAAGYPLAQAMRLANTAAGIVVSKLGTATVELDELMLELARDVRDTEWHRAKHYTVARDRGVGAALEEPRVCGSASPMAASISCMPGMSRCSRRRARNATGWSSRSMTDRGVRRLKGPKRPVNELADRAAVIAAIEAVDAVISFDEETPIELIRRLAARRAGQGRRLHDRHRGRRRGSAGVGRPGRAGRSRRGAFDDRPDPRDPGRVRATDAAPDRLVNACW